MSEPITDLNEEAWTPEEHRQIAETIQSDAWDSRERDESLQDTLHRTNTLLDALTHALLSLHGTVLQPGAIKNGDEAP